MEGWVDTGNGFRVPGHVYEIPRRELIYRIHGIVCGEYKCPHCSRVYMEEDYPSGQCVECGTPLPHVCVNKTCINVVDPIRVEGENGGVMYYPPTLDCSECQKFAGRAQRAAYIEAITPSYIHKNLGAAYYWNREGRGRLDEDLKGWFTSERCGELSRVHMLYVHGEAGTGKSVGVMYHAAINHLSRKVDGLFYACEDSLINHNAERYADSRDIRDRALSYFTKCSTTPLLIVDDLGSRANYRPAQVEMYARVLGERLRLGKATIVIGRRPPVDGSPFSWIPGQLSGAFRGAGRSILVRA